MSSDLQGLIDRIRKEGVDKAESEAGEIVAEARRIAGEILRRAESEAGALRDRAQAEAAALEAQGRETLAKAARDLVLSVHQALERSLAAVVQRRVEEALAPDMLRNLITMVVSAYLERAGESGGVDLLISPEDRDAVVDYFLQTFRSAVDAGLEVRSDRSVFRGFKVALDGDQVRHDFTAAAIADAMAGMVRPRLAAILRQADLSAKDSAE